MSFIIQEVQGERIQTEMSDYLVWDKNGHFYLCQWAVRPLRLKCGKCLRGVLSKRRGKLIVRVGVISKCGVCSSRVTHK